MRLPERQLPLPEMSAVQLAATARRSCTTSGAAGRNSPSTRCLADVMAGNKRAG